MELKYNDTKPDGTAKCYFCGKWKKDYKNISKIVCIECDEKINNVLDQYVKEKNNG